MTVSPLSELANNITTSVAAFVSAVGGDPLPNSECAKIVAAIAALQAVYRDSCNGGV